MGYHVEAKPSERDHGWSSAGLSSHRALTAWNNVISSNVAEMTIDSSQHDGFAAEWQSIGLGPIDLHNFRVTEQTISRSASMARRSRDEVYALSYMQSGCAAVHHDGVDIHVPEGSFVLVSHARPYRMHFPDSSLALTAHMPDSWFRRWVPQPETMLARPFDGNRWGAPLAAILSTIDSGGLDGLVLPRSAIADQLGAFLAIINGNATCGKSLHQGEFLRRAKQIMRDRLDDPEFSPTSLAQALDVSKRYVHKLFASDCTTFGATLLELRLQRAAEMLADPRYTAYRVGTVAYACGFSDSSHFARRFRERFGRPPLVFKGMN